MDTLAIIAAGESSRMRAEGISLPKPMLPIGGNPLIDRTIHAGMRAGVTRICCIINDHAPELQEHLLTHPCRKALEMKLLVRSTPSSMHSLFALAPWLGDGMFLLATGDSVFDEQEFLAFAETASRARDAEGVLGVTRYIDDEKPLCVRMDAGNSIVEFSDSNDGYEFATAGLYCFSPRVFEYASEAGKAGMQRLRNYLRLLLAHNFTMQGFEFSTVIDVDHAGDILKAEEFLKHRAAGQDHLHA